MCHIYNIEVGNLRPDTREFWEASPSFTNENLLLLRQQHIFPHYFECLKKMGIEIGRAVLDVGAGEYPVTHCLLDESRRVHAVDFAVKPKQDGFLYAQVDISKLPDKKEDYKRLKEKLKADSPQNQGRVDLIVISCVLNYVPYKDVLKVLAEDFLNDGGVLLIANQAGLTFDFAEKLLPNYGVQSSFELRSFLSDPDLGLELIFQIHDLKHEPDLEPELLLAMQKVGTIIGPYSSIRKSRLFFENASENENKTNIASRELLYLRRIFGLPYTMQQQIARELDSMQGAPDYYRALALQYLFLAPTFNATNMIGAKHTGIMLDIVEYMRARKLLSRVLSENVIQEIENSTIKVKITEAILQELLNIARTSSWDVILRILEKESILNAYEAEEIKQLLAPIATNIKVITI